MTHDEILLAAAQLFGDKGFHGASMQDVADAVNLKKGSLYHHISSKQELLVQILDRALNLLISSVEEISKSNLSPAEKIEKGMIAYLETLAQNPSLPAVLLLEHNSLEPKYREEHIKRRDYYEGFWRGMIEEGVESGDFQCSSINLTTKALLSILNWTVTWYRKDGSLSIEAISEYFTQIILGGMGYEKLNE